MIALEFLQQRGIDTSDASEAETETVAYTAKVGRRSSAKIRLQWRVEDLDSSAGHKLAAGRKLIHWR